MVSPQNPLKDGTNNFQQRFDLTRSFVRDPRMVVTDIEGQMNTQYSFQTVKELKRRFPKTKFTWLAGMDNALIFHQWDNWKSLLRAIPFIFLNRPPHSMAINNNAIRMFKGTKSVRWCLAGKTRNISSTALRQRMKRYKFVPFLKNKVY